MATCTIRLRPTLRLFFENKHAYFPPAGYRRVYSLGPDLSDAMGARARAGLLALRMDKIRSRRFLVSHADGLDRPDISTFSFHLGGPQASPLGSIPQWPNDGRLMEPLGILVGSAKALVPLPSHVRRSCPFPASNSPLPYAISPHDRHSNC